MTRFTVVWKKTVLGELASIWNDTSDRPGVSVAADAVDTYLSIDPDLKGDFLAEDLWAVTLPPLRVYYTVNHDDRIVTVVGVAELAADS